MSHKAGHIIIKALRETGLLTPEQNIAVDAIEFRDQYKTSERLYLGYLVQQLAPKLVVENASGS